MAKKSRAIRLEVLEIAAELLKLEVRLDSIDRYRFEHRKALDNIRAARNDLLGVSNCSRTNHDEDHCAPDRVPWSRHEDRDEDAAPVRRMLSPDASRPPSHEWMSARSPKTHGDSRVNHAEDQLAEDYKIPKDYPIWNWAWEDE